MSFADDISVILGALSSTSPAIVVAHLLQTFSKRTLFTTDYSKTATLMIQAMTAACSNRKSWAKIKGQVKIKVIHKAFMVNRAPNWTMLTCLAHCIMIAFSSQPNPDETKSFGKLAALYREKFNGMKTIKHASQYQQEFRAAGKKDKADILAKFALMDWSQAEQDEFKDAVAGAIKLIDSSSSKVRPKVLAQRVARARGVGGAEDAGEVSEEEEEEQKTPNPDQEVNSDGGEV